MSEFDGMDELETRLTPDVTDAKSSRWKLIGVKGSLRYREMIANNARRKHFLSEAGRTKPTLARVKWLERPDP